MGIFMFWLSIALLLGIGGAVRKQLPVGIALVFAAVGEVLGIYVRYWLIASGQDRAFGPTGDYVPETNLVDSAFWYISLFNYSLLFGVLLVFAAQKAASKHRPIQPGQVPKSSVAFYNDNLLLKVLFAVSAPGILLAASTFLGGGTLVANSDLEATRIDVAGNGPLIYLKEFPLISLLVWFTYKKGKVGYKWITLISLYTGNALLTGNRSKMVTVILMLIALFIIQKGYRVIIKRFPLFLVMGVVGFYLGWIIIYARGSLMKFGGSFSDAVIRAVQFDPGFIFARLYRGSFNGFDGFLSIISNVPQNMGYSIGRFWYESATILIPRTIWSSKWNLPITNIFTYNVWKWEKGGIFVTGPGVMYLDSGIQGVILGAIFLGVSLTIFLSLVKRKFSNHAWITNFCAASTAFFMSRFVFAGGSNDVVFFQRLVIGVFVIAAGLYAVKLLRRLTVRYRAVPVVRLGANTIKGMEG